MRNSLVAFLFCISTYSISAQSCLPDLTFGYGGNVIYGSLGQEFGSLLLQNDQKALVLSFNSQYNFSLITRFKTDGIFDSSFGENSKTSFNGIFKNMQLQDDGKIIVAGSIAQTSSPNFYKDFALMRFKANGARDSTFGVAGFLQTDFSTPGNYTNDIVYSVVVQNNKKILVAGLSGSESIIVRYNYDGIIDSTFGVDGKLTANFSINKIGLTGSDEKIIACGSSISAGIGQFIVAQFNNNGTVDNTFGTGGKTISVIGNNAELTAMKIQPDGKVLTGGFFYNVSDSDIVLVRYKANGTLDSAFGINGKTITDVYLNEIVNSITLQPDEKIVISAISTYQYTFGKPSLLRYKSNGILDSAFNTNGKYSIANFSLAYSSAINTTVAIQNDGMFIVGATHLYSRYPSDIFLGRYYVADFIVPVNLLFFNGSSNGHNVQLNWAITGSSNHHYFLVERSNNGVDFSSINRIDNQDNSKFQFTSFDTNPLIGQNYYRLKQVDNDGKFYYSQVVAVKFEDHSSFTIYPNPTNGIIKINDVKPTGDIDLKIINSIGKVVKEIKGFNVNDPVNITDQPKGVYFVTMVIKGVYYKKIIVKI